MTTFILTTASGTTTDMDLDSVHLLGYRMGWIGSEPDVRFSGTCPLADAYHEAYALGVQERWYERSAGLRSWVGYFGIKRSLQIVYTDLMSLTRRQVASEYGVSLKDARLLARQAARI